MPSSNLYIGVDVGGTKVLGGVVDESGKILKTLRNDTPKNGGAELNKVVADVVLELHKEFAASGVCITAPGFISSDRRTVLAVPNIPDWDQRDLASEIKELTGLSCVIENDANAAAWGEAIYGAGKGISHSIILTIGTGIGGAIIIDGKLFGGYENRGTELGHIPLFFDGIPCSCGSVGCLEAYASTSALIQQFNDKCNKLNTSFGNEITGKLISEFYHHNNSIAVECLTNHWAYLGRGIAGLVNIFSPQKVVIGGGISESGAFYLKHLEKEFRKYVMPDCAVNTQLCLAKLGNKAGILGAAQFAYTNLK